MLPKSTQIQLFATSTTSSVFTAKDSVKVIIPKGRNKLYLNLGFQARHWPTSGYRYGTGEYRFYDIALYPLSSYLDMDTGKTA